MYYLFKIKRLRNIKRTECHFLTILFRYYFQKFARLAEIVFGSTKNCFAFPVIFICQGPISTWPLIIR